MDTFRILVFRVVGIVARKAHVCLYTLRLLAPRRLAEFPKGSSLFVPPLNTCLRSLCFLLKQFLWVLLVIPSLMWADAESHLMTWLSSQKTYSAQFVQTSYSKEGKALEQSKGICAIKRPGRLFWKVEQPTHQKVVVDGKNVWNYDEDLAQVTVTPFHTQNNFLEMFLLGTDAKKLHQTYQVREASEDPTEISFILTPRQKDTSFQRIVLNILMNRLSQIEVLDHLEQRTVFTFDRVQVNSNLDDGIFKFTPPPDVEVIRQGT